LLVAATVDFVDTIQAHILKSWNFLILQMDGFLATYRLHRFTIGMIDKAGNSFIRPSSAFHCSVVQVLCWSVRCGRFC